MQVVNQKQNVKKRPRREPAGASYPRKKGLEESFLFRTRPSSAGVPCSHLFSLQGSVLYVQFPGVLAHWVKADCSEMDIHDEKSAVLLTDSGTLLHPSGNLLEEQHRSLLHLFHSYEFHSFSQSSIFLVLISHTQDSWRGGEKVWSSPYQPKVEKSDEINEAHL